MSHDTHTDTHTIDARVNREATPVSKPTTVHEIRVVHGVFEEQRGKRACCYYS